MRILLAISVLAIIAVFAGCAGNEAQTTVPPETTAAPTETPQTTAPATTAPAAVSGETVYQAKCAGCHPAGDAKVDEFTTSGHGTWIAALDKMKNYGVQMSTDEYDAVKNYLINTYGVPAGT